MASISLKSQIDFSGPFFTRDPAKAFAENIRDFLQEIADDIAADVRQQMQAGEGGRAPVAALGNRRVSEFIRGRVEALAGKPWHYHAVISPDKSGLSDKQAIALYAAASQIERRSHPFGRSVRATRRQRTNLTKGME